METVVATWYDQGVIDDIQKHKLLFIATQDAAANNEFFTTQADSIIDFSEVNPFSEVDRY